MSIRVLQQECIQQLRKIAAASVHIIAQVIPDCGQTFVSDLFAVRVLTLNKHMFKRVHISAEFACGVDL